MAVETFELERNQSLYENEVEINLTESGVEPMSLRELLTPGEIETLLDLRLGYGHTEGTPALRDAIASWYPGATRENVLVTTGASEANFLCAWSLLGPGDHAIVIVPNFMQIPGAARSLGVDVDLVPLDAGAGFALDLAAIRRALRPETRLITLCNPNNPTGRIFREVELRALADLAEEAGAWLLCDEIYRGAEIGDEPETPTVFGLGERVIVTASTSKALAHAGLRLGWIVGPEAMVYEAMRHQDYTTIGSGPVNQYLGERLLRPAGRARMLARTRAILDANLPLIEDWVARWNGRLRFRRPMAGAMAFVGYDLDIGSEALAQRLREEQSVLVVAGAWFGMERHLRIGTGGHPETLREGLARVDRVLETLT